MSRVIKAHDLSVQPGYFVVSGAEGGAADSRATVPDDFSAPAFLGWDDSDREGSPFSDGDDEACASEDEEPEALRDDSPEGAERRELLEEARLEAERLVAEAREGAESVLAQAREEAAAIKDAAHRDGLAQGRETGYGEGYEAGVAEGEAALKEYTEQALRLLEATEAARERILVSSRDDVLKIVMKCAEKVIRAAVTLDADVVARSIESALALVGDKSRILIKVNESDLNRAREAGRHFEQFLPSSARLEVLGDGAIKPGGCYVESLSGSVDAQIETQLDEVFSALEGAVHGE